MVDRLDGVQVSKQLVRDFLKRYVTHQTICRNQVPSRITTGIKQIIEDAMHHDDEMTATKPTRYIP